MAASPHQPADPLAAAAAAPSHTVPPPEASIPDIGALAPRPGRAGHRPEDAVPAPASAVLPRPGGRLATWRDLPPAPPYGAVPPPRPHLPHHDPPLPSGVAPAGRGGRVAAVVVGALAVVGLGVLLGLWLSGEDQEDPVATSGTSTEDALPGIDEPMPLPSVPDDVQPSAPRPLIPDDGSAAPAPAPDAPGGVPPQLPPELEDLFDSVVPGGDAVRLFTVAPLERWDESVTSLQHEETTDGAETDQTTVLESADGDEAEVRGHRGVDAQERFEDLLSEPGATPTQVDGLPAVMLERDGRLVLAWLDGDLLLEVDVPADAGEDSARELADGVELAP